jgi:CO/xanthine dehydrogenase Mo-binding subunit
MGQQQLLLLVLSTVIVGLATVAGIQAFSENQQQATQDALVQRAISIGSDVLSAHNEPSQFGGVDLTNGPSKSKIATAAGYDSSTPPADGAGDGASCTIGTTIGNPTLITCATDGSTSNDSSTEAQFVEVGINPNTGNVTVTKINRNTVTSTSSV